MVRNSERHFENYKEHMILEHIKSKTARDISLKVRSEQSRTFRMNAMLFFVALLLLIGIYALFYVNSDFNYEPFEANFKQRISSFGNVNFFSDAYNNKEIEKKPVVENGFESG